MKDFAVPSNSNFMFSLLLLIPTVYMHSTVQGSQMIIVFPEGEKRRKLFIYRIFQYRRKSVIYQHLKKYYQNNYHWEKLRNTGKRTWEDGLFSAFCNFLAGTREFVTYSRNGLMGLTHLKLRNHRANTMNTCGKKKTKPKNICKLI